MIACQPYHGIILELQADEEDQRILLTSLNSIKNVEANMTLDPNAYDDWFYGHASAVEHLVNTLVTITATAGSVASIAQALHEFLLNRRQKTKRETIRGFGCSANSPPPHDTSIPDGTIRIIHGRNRLEIGKNTSTRKVEAALARFSTKGNHRYATRPLRKRLLVVRLRETKEEMENVEQAVTSYEELVDAFEKTPSPKHKWQKDRLRGYKQRLRRYDAKEKFLRSKISRLEAAIDRLSI